jgi:hypothetical protein
LYSFDTVLTGSGQLLSQAGYRALSAVPPGAILPPNQPLNTSLSQADYRALPVVDTDTSLSQAGYRGLSALPAGTVLPPNQPLDTSLILSQADYRLSAVPGTILNPSQPLDTSLILSQADNRLLANLYISCKEIVQDLFNQDQLIEILEAV